VKTEKSFSVVACKHLNVLRLIYVFCQHCCYAFFIVVSCVFCLPVNMGLLGLRHVGTDVCLHLVLYMCVSVLLGAV